jgi:DNA (cytosine-5)-methyltransferase 1
MPSSALQERIPRESQLDFFDGLVLNKKVSSQVALLRRCRASGLSLGQELARAGMTYDDLIYAQNPPVLVKGARYYRLEDFSRKANQIPVVSFFSGAGGADLGFEAAGFRHVALIEHNATFCATLRANRPQWAVIGPPNSAGDVSDLEAMSTDIGERIGSAKSFDGVFVGGPPCQPFSIAANQRFAKSGKNFKRVGFAHETNGNLLFDFIEIIARFRPRAFLIENVPGLFDVDGGQQLKKAIARLTAAGYSVVPPFVLNAASYLVPQHRNRLFIVGALGKRSFKRPEGRTTMVPCIRALQRIRDKVPNNETREHEAESILRYMTLSYGQREKLGRVDRLHPGLPSKTVIAGGTSGGGRSHLHPYVPRTLSVRECARLQTFPDDYALAGASARQFTQVGNAVPPVLAVQMALAIAASYF